MRSKKPDLEDVVEQFEAWRAKPRGRLIPDRLWKAALGLLGRYSSGTICRHLRFNSERFKQVQEARGQVVVRKRPMRRGRLDSGKRAAHTGRHRSAAAARVVPLGPSRNAFVELAPLGVAVGGGIVAPPLREVQRGPTGCRLTLEGAAGTITVATASADRGLADALCRFVEALANGSRT